MGYFWTHMVQKHYGDEILKMEGQQSHAEHTRMITGGWRSGNIRQTFQMLCHFTAAEETDGQRRIEPQLWFDGAFLSKRATWVTARGTRRQPGGTGQLVGGVLVKLALSQHPAAGATIRILCYVLRMVLLAIRHGTTEQQRPTPELRHVSRYQPGQPDARGETPLCPQAVTLNTMFMVKIVFLSQC